METEATNKSHILESIRILIDKAEKSKLSENFFSKNHAELMELANYFNSTPMQAVLLSSILVYNFNRGLAGLDDLSRFFDCNPLQILEYKQDLDILLQRGLLKKELDNRSNRAIKSYNITFFVPENITESILGNLPIKDQGPAEIKDIFDLLEHLYNLGSERDNDRITTDELIDKSMEIISQYDNFPLIKKMKIFELTPENQVMLFYLYWKYINGTTEVDLETAVKGIFDRARKRFEYSKELLLNEHQLIKNELVEVEKRKFFNDTVIMLKSKSIEILESCEFQSLVNKKRKDNVVLPTDIFCKTLIFNSNEEHQLHLLKQSLLEENLKPIQDRMKLKGLPTGFTIMFYGVPGTGKTESVYQLAKETGREIMFVDISKSKSCWFGESEKIIKAVFTDYYSLLKESKISPILLFNEADGVFSKRKEVGYSNVAQTENAIQNIILQELELFTGILVATTNLISNFDKAFERRFLYKIGFSKPDNNIRSQIWKLKLPELSISDAKALSERFDFSGGQIDNIARKYEITGIIEGRNPNIHELLKFCAEEQFTKSNYTKIGYLN